MYLYCILFPVATVYLGISIRVLCGSRALNCILNIAHLPNQLLLLLRCRPMHTRECHHRDALLPMSNWVQLKLQFIYVGFINNIIFCLELLSIDRPAWRGRGWPENVSDNLKSNRNFYRNREFKELYIKWPPVKSFTCRLCS